MVLKRSYPAIVNLTGLKNFQNSQKIYALPEKITLNVTQIETETRCYRLS